MFFVDFKKNWWMRGEIIFNLIFFCGEELRVLRKQL